MRLKFSAFSTHYGYLLSVICCIYNASMKVSSISFETFEILLHLQKHFIVVFVSSWSQKSRPYSSLLASGSQDLMVLEILVDASSLAEDYCIDALKSKNLPVACLFVSGQLWKSYEYDEMICLPMNINAFGPIFTESQLISFDLDNSIDVLDVLFQPNGVSDEPIYIFISGDRSSVGKSTTCLALLASLVNRGIDPSLLAYIKPVTQCEATQPVVLYCERVGIAHQGIGPVVFYKGFTRAYLAGETDTSEQLIQSAVTAVRAIGRGKHFVLVDGVGYPSVGSICNISNADVARALDVPVLLVGKEGVGDAVDSYNINAAFFEIKGVTVLGGVFNKLPLTGFYSLEACQTSVSSYFRQFKPAQFPYGFIPTINNEPVQQVMDDQKGAMDVVQQSFEDVLSESFLKYVDVPRLLFDVWKYNKILKNVRVVDDTTTRPAAVSVVSSAASSLTRPPPLPSTLPFVVSKSTAPVAPMHAAQMVKTPQKLAPINGGTVGSSSTSNNGTKNTAAETPVAKVNLKRTREEVERDAAAQGAKGG